jgi:hypothetical protein
MTKNVCKVIGTGLNGRGMNIQPPIPVRTAKTVDRVRSIVFKVVI